MNYQTVKRIIDVIIASLLLIILLPFCILVALATWPMFCQTRVGKNGKEFKCFKFRSMIKNADKIKLQNQHQDDRTFKIKNDPRITFIGRIIRKWSIDEIPQLINVLIGDMSLVGPRPPSPTEVTLYDHKDLKRLDIKPGLTCIWQVSGRANIPFSEQIKMDIEYIKNMGLLIDLKLLFLTIPTVLLKKGAY